MRCADIADLFWPEPCAVCTRPVILARYHDSPNRNILSSGKYPLCGKCAESLPAIPEPRCDVCGCELVSERVVCMRCRSRSYIFTHHVSLFPYRDSARELVHAYKFEKRYRLATFFAENLARQWRARFAPCPVVTVPPRRKAIQSPFYRDHVERIANLMRKRFAVPVLHLLQRTFGTPQKTLDYEGRLSNLKGKFFISDTVNFPVNETLVLLDDVFTTGATINECADVLLQGGAESVCGLTIAID